MSIFHVQRLLSPLIVFSRTELSIILHLAKSCIDPTLYLISMDHNVLCIVHALFLSVSEIKPLGRVLVYRGCDK